MIETISADLYNHVAKIIVDQDINLLTADIRAALFTDSFVFDPEHTTWANVKANQISGDGYVSGGQAITHDGDIFEYDSAAGIYAYGKNADSILWDNSSFITKHVVIYEYIDNVGSPDDSSLLLGTKEFGELIHTNNGSFTLVWDATIGIFRFRMNP